MNHRTLVRCAGVVLGCLAVSFASGSRAEESETGFSIGFEHITDYFSNVSGGIATGSDFIGLGNLYADHQGGAWSWHANLFLPYGTSFTERHAGDFSVASNIDTGNLDPRLAEFWWQRDVGSTNVRFGMLALDTEFWGSAGGSVFINSVFGAPTIISANLPNPSIFPTATLGVRGQWRFGLAGLLRIAVVDGDAGDPVDANEHGLNVNFRSNEGVFVAAEYELDWTPEGGMPALFKMGAFHHSGELETIDGSRRSSTAGVYAIVDQPLGERFGWFGRIGYTRKALAYAPWSVEVGLNFADLLGSGGTLGIGVAHVDINDAVGPALGFTPENETVIEITFEWPVTDWFTLQPDLQYILNTGGFDEGGRTVVLGVRGKMSF